MSARCAVIGAGAAGLAAAHELQACGLAVVLYDKGRRAGGRMSTRETAFGSFDHGAQFLRLRDAQWQRAGEAWQRDHVLQPWPAAHEAGRATAWIGTPTMNALAQHWARGLHLHCHRTVEALHRKAGAWWLRLVEDGAAGPFDRVLVTVPAAQALNWIEDPAMRAALAGVVYAPCLSLMWVPAVTALPEPACARPDAQTGIGFLAREDLKPGRGGAPRYLVQANASWSEQHRSEPAEIWRDALLDSAARWLGIARDAHHLQAHRWLYAQVTTAVGSDFLRGDHGLFYAGDGCLGGRIEAALHSGRAVARALIDTLDT